MSNRFQEAISEIARARKTNLTVRKRLEKHDQVLEMAARLLRESGVRPYVKRDKPPKKKRRTISTKMVENCA